MSNRNLFIVAEVSFLVAMAFFLLAIWLPSSAGDLAGKFGGTGAIALVIAIACALLSVLRYLSEEW